MVVLNDALEVDNASAVVVATGFIVVVDGALVVGNLTNDKRFDPLHRFNPNSLNSKAYFPEITACDRFTYHLIQSKKLKNTSICSIEKISM